MIEAYPLSWPVGYKRYEYHRKRSAFRQTMDGSQRFLREEIKRLGASDLIVSTNLRVRADGGLYASDLDKVIPDPGVAIYFKYKKKDVSMCCDKYSRVWENIFALGKGIEALRGMERWGVSDFLDRAFTGFTALPESTQAPKEWWKVFNYDKCPGNKIWDWNAIAIMYKALAKRLHPDIEGGSVEKFQELNSAFQEAKVYFGYAQ